MQDFDTARDERLKADRSFKIGGETFTHRAAVAPEEIMGWNDLTEGTAGADTPGSGWLKALDETVLVILEPGQEELWAKVRDPKLQPQPLSVGDLVKVMEWLIEKVVATPTSEPAASGRGRARTAMSSTGVSSSEPVAA